MIECYQRSDRWHLLYGYRLLNLPFHQDLLVWRRLPIDPHEQRIVLLAASLARSDNSVIPMHTAQLKILRRV